MAGLTRHPLKIIRRLRVSAPPAITNYSVTQLLNYSVIQLFSYSFVRETPPSCIYINMKEELIRLIEKFLRKQASTEEIARLKELFAQAEAKEWLSDFYEEKWEQADFSTDKEAEQRILAKLREQIPMNPERRKLPLWKKSLRIAASIAAPLFFVGLGYCLSQDKSKQNDDKTTVNVEIGQKANIQLPDGTQVWLNSAGSLAYDHSFNGKERVVYLKGEACFEVNKDKTRPFIVKTNDISIEALGTKFNVKAYPEDNYVMATLLEGSIRVTSPFQSEVMKPNEKLTFIKGAGQFTKSLLPDADRNISWVAGQLAFDRERLEDIAKILERMYSIRIRFASENLKDIRFSGALKNNSLENVLQLITFVSPVSYSLENDTTFVIHSK